MTSGLYLSISERAAFKAKMFECTSDIIAYFIEKHCIIFQFFLSTMVNKTLVFICVIGYNIEAEGVRLRIADKRGGKIENMKVRKGFVLRKVGDTQYAVATGEALKYFKGMLKLNEMGAYMFTLLQEDTNANKIADRILESFDADKETVLADVNDFIAKLKSINVIED